MKKVVVIIIFIIFITGCDNKLENNKNDYLTYKNELNKTELFTLEEDLPCDIMISVDRTSEEEVSYRAIIDNPKEDMKNIRALIVHNYFTEDVFPSIGIFDDVTNLIIGNEDIKGIELVGYIETTKEIEALDLEIRVYLQYETVNGVKKEIYYKSTN